MSKMLIYIGENEKFNVPGTIDAIKSMAGTSRAREGSFIGAIFECEYTAYGRNTIVRISPEAETITVEGLGDEALDFALQLQRHLPVALHATDMDYSFNVGLANFSSIAELRKAIAG